MSRYQKALRLCFGFLLTATLTWAQYEGYSLIKEGDPESTLYETASTPANVTTFPAPDVFLNASVHVGGIYLDVENITVKISLDAQVKKLLHFNAGVRAHIDRVKLSIENVDAKLKLEARLENLVLMINDVLHSLDLNPILATLGNDLGNLVNNTVGGLTGQRGQNAQGRLSTRSIKLEKNILYSVNDYSGKTHTNRILGKNGDVIDQYLDNNGIVSGEKVIGTYETEMTFNGHNISMTWDGEAVRELEYVYTPFLGISVVSAVFVNDQGKVVGTQMLSDSMGGGSSTIAND